MVYKLIQFVLYYIVLFCLFIYQSKADTISNVAHFPIQKERYSVRYQPLILASGLIGFGIASQTTPTLRRLDRNTKHYANRIFDRKTHIDDFLQYSPALAVYALDMTGLKAKHSIAYRTATMTTAAVLAAGTVHALKRSTAVVRPDGSNTKSFPSGHTATAFIGAHMLFREYQDENIWVASTGYIVAISTGMLRILNDKHWFSDVAAGAGFGILSTELSYLLTPKLKNILERTTNKKNTIVIPDLSGDYPTLKVAIYF